ncbi:MAG: VRR-NUC domain-containing protein [Clostridia bacterium]|nr:VRR-NUC domain-containing protein [Clostridia bacterium]
MRESEIEKILRVEIEKLNGVCFKFISPGNIGVPDRIVIYPGGKIHFIELKTKKGVLSKAQELQISVLRSKGAEVFVIFGIDGVKQYLEGLKNEV